MGGYIDGADVRFFSIISVYQVVWFLAPSSIGKSDLHLTSVINDVYATLAMGSNIHM